MNNISVRKMRIYLAAVEEGNFTRAAVRENISQPAATIVINEIEETIGAQLFERRGSVRQAKVTEAGQMVTETFARIVSGYDSEISSIGEMVGGGSKINRVLLQRGFSDSLSGAWILSISEAFAPCQISVETLERSQIVDAIQGREAAVGLIEGHADHDRCEQVQLGTYALVLAVPTTEGKAPAIEPLEDWTEVPTDCLLFGDLNPQLSRKLKRQMEPEGVEMDRLMKLSCPSAMARIMRETGRAAIVPDVLVPALSSICPCETRVLPGMVLDGAIGMVAPWGTLGRSGLANVTDGACFVE